MESTIDRHSESHEGASNTADHEAWEALRHHLESRSRDLCDEVRHYPTPIARCDVQLTKLIEQRTHALESLRQFNDAACGHSTPPADSAIQDFIAAYVAADDDVEAALVARLKAACGHADGRR